MKDNWMKKWFVVSVILLFIGIAVAPSINFKVVKASNDNDLVEVTTQACGIKGYGNTTVKLTRQQYQNLEQYLVEFRTRLNQSKTRKEAVPLFKKAVVELNKYGLLPKGMSVQQIQKLVNGGYQNEKIMKFLEKISNLNKGTFNNSNFLCLLAGETSNTSFYGFPLRSLLNIDKYFFKFLVFLVSRNHTIPSSLYDIYWLLNLISFYCIFFINSSFLQFPIKFRNDILFGEQGTNFSSPSQGWISSFGLLGNKRWENSFFGAIFPVGFGLMGAWRTCYFGGVGFTGISISTQQKQTAFFLGTAIHIQIVQA